MWLLDDYFNKCSFLQVSSSSLFVPEPEDAVAHGDANLAVNDFLAKAPL